MRIENCLRFNVLIPVIEKSSSDYFEAHGWEIWRVLRSLGGNLTTQ